MFQLRMFIDGVCYLLYVTKLINRRLIVKGFILARKSSKDLGYKLIL